MFPSLASLSLSLFFCKFHGAPLFNTLSPYISLTIIYLSHFIYPTTPLSLSPLHLSQSVHPTALISLSISLTPSVTIYLLLYTPWCLSLYLILSIFISRSFCTFHGASSLFLSPSFSICASHGAPFYLSLSLSLSFSLSYSLSICPSV